MLKSLATSAVVGFVRKRAGVTRVGTIPAALLTSGASLMLTRGKRPVGLAVAALGGFLLWREIERDQAEVSSEPRPAPLPPASGDASAATARR